MKKLTGFLIFLYLCTSGLAAQDSYYVYEGERIPLTLNTGYAYLLLDGVDAADALEAMIPELSVTKFGVNDASNTLKAVPGASYRAEGRFWAEVALPNQDRAPESYLAYLKNLENRAYVRLAAPFYSDEDDPKIGISEFFVVRLYQPEDLESLKAMAKRTGTRIVGQNQFMANWYTLSCTAESEGNALEMANLFAESGKFSAAQPDMMIDDEVSCVNDAMFGDQWGLKHQGQNGWFPGVDIKACQGWNNWTIGNSDIHIAILDDGFERNHPDLSANNVGLGWDTESGSAPSQVLGPHGTPCAGIAAARQSNQLGISGVCPGCKLISVSNSMTRLPLSRQKRGDGINWAWKNGAAVISNSWRSGVMFSIIDDAIDSALTFGRNGLGTLICFSTGNVGDTFIDYPANSNPDILAIGAMSPCGERKSHSSCDGENWWGSNYGDALDVLAPGVYIPTTDRVGFEGYITTGAYHPKFNGTSSACPHVAGLIGLILSVNPCLDHEQVADIIEQTAQKVGGYSYSTTAGRPNGTWNDEMGYGLINVDAALEMAAELLLQNQTVSVNDDYNAGIIRAGSNVDPSQTSGPFIIASTATVTMTASTGISLEPGFSVIQGATFSAITSQCGTLKMANSSGQQADEVAQVVSDASAISGTGAFTVFPNPFRNGLTVSFTVSEPDSRVELQVFNLQGREVARPLSGGLWDEGLHQQKLIPEQKLPAGLYMVRLCINGDCKIKKIVKE